MKQQNQWVGIFLGLVIILSFVAVYMYRKSNYETMPYTPVAAPTSNVVATPTSNTFVALPPVPQVAELPAPSSNAIESAYMYENYAMYGDGTGDMKAAPIVDMPQPKVSTFAPMPDELLSSAYENEDAFQEIDFQVVDKYGRETPGDASQTP
jgi:hypothetical protein